MYNSARKSEAISSAGLASLTFRLSISSYRKAVLRRASSASNWICVARAKSGKLKPRSPNRSSTSIHQYWCKASSAASRYPQRIQDGRSCTANGASTAHIKKNQKFMAGFLIASRQMSSVQSVPVNIENPESQEQTLVHDVYNQIASHFASTRYKPWPVVEKFLLERRDHSIGIDVGCGNGKYLAVNPNIYTIGTDRSEGLVECAHDLNRSYNLGIADGLHLPHSDNTFDFAISVAVIHHFSTEQRRVEAIRHILSKLAVGGEALLYVWALEQEKSARGFKPGDNQDMLVPWVKRPGKGEAKKKKTRRANEEIQPEQPAPPDIKYRYYHLYHEGELRANCEAAGRCQVISEGYDKDNWWIIVRKISQ